MIPNNQPDADSRFRRLTEAIKLVYASTFFAAASRYRDAAGCGQADEKMAVDRPGGRGPAARRALLPRRVGRGAVVQLLPQWQRAARGRRACLALGLGKTIVDGGLAWSYSPAYPHATPPFASPSELLEQTQSEFWAVNMGGPPRYDPVAETEYLVRSDLADAEEDGTLRYTASSYDAASDRLQPGLRGRGPRVLTFAPLLVLEELPLNASIRELLAVCGGRARRAGRDRVRADAGARRRAAARLGFLQVRPMAVVVASGDDRAPDELDDPRAGSSCRGRDGQRLDDGIADVVFVRPETFDARPDAGHRRRHRRDEPRLVDGAPAVPADRLRPLGQLGPVARHPGRLDPDRRGARDRRDRASRG